MRNSYTLSFSLLAAMLAAMNFFVFYFFPATEGWWQAYAYLLSKDLRPYESFNMAFPPLFIYFNLILLKLSSYYIVYRLLGIAFVLLIFVVLSRILCKFYSQFISLIASFLGVSLMMNIYLFIPNDYHVFVNALTIVSVFFYVAFSTSSSWLPKTIYVYLTALFLVATLLTKQNVGFFVSLAILLILVLEDFRYRTTYSLHFVAGYISLFLGLSSLLNLPPEQFWVITFHNDAKGSLFTILFNFILNDLNRKYLIFSVLIAAIYFYYRKSEQSHLLNNSIYWVVVCALLLFVYRHQSPVVAFLITSTLSYLWIEVSKFKKSKLRVGLLLIFMSLIYANTLTADITMMYLFFVSAFLIAEILTFIESNFSPLKFKASCYGLVVIFFTAHIHDKFNHPYEWWGGQSKLNQAKYSLPYKQLNYIKVDKATANLFETIKDAIEKYSRGNDVYLFPRIPIFYALHDKLPPTHNVVQWFDVISQRNMENEIEEVEAARPNLIIMLTSSGAAYSIHEALKKIPQAQSRVANFFDTQVANGSYRLVKYQIVNNDIFATPASADGVLTITYQVINPAIFGQTVTNLNALPNNVSIISANSNGKNLYFTDMLSHKLQPFDQLVIQAPASKVDLIAQIIGPPDERSEIFNAVKIYKRLSHN